LEITDLLAKLVVLEADARRLLARHEASASRTVTLEDSYARLAKLSLRQDEAFRECLRAIEATLFRAAHVIGWAGFMDFLHEYLAADGLKALKDVRPKWNLSGLDDLRDWGDFQVIEAGRDAHFYSKTTMKALHGLLGRRNECAHPSDYYPDFNQTLGFIAELFQRIEFLQSKRPQT
jgi:hypothetical protein